MLLVLGGKESIIAFIIIIINTIGHFGSLYVSTQDSRFFPHCSSYQEKHI
jgi:hypothetical protein